jgi:hypothetical protein
MIVSTLLSASKNHDVHKQDVTDLELDLFLDLSGHLVTRANSTQIVGARAGISPAENWFVGRADEARCFRSVACNRACRVQQLRRELSWWVFAFVRPFRCQNSLASGPKR